MKNNTKKSKKVLTYYFKFVIIGLLFEKRARWSLKTEQNVNSLLARNKQFKFQKVCKKNKKCVDFDNSIWYISIATSEKAVNLLVRIKKIKKLLKNAWLLKRHLIY